MIRAGGPADRDSDVRGAGRLC